MKPEDVQLDVEPWPNCDYTGRPCLDVSQVCRCEKCKACAAILLRRVSGKGAQARPKFATNDVEQRQIDIINLRLYARLAEENEWKDDVLHWSVFQQTLEAIATRLERLPSPAPVPTTPRIVELTPPNAPDKYAVFIGRMFVWEFDYEHEAKELLGNLQRATTQGTPEGAK